MRFLCNGRGRKTYATQRLCHSQAHTDLMSQAIVQFRGRAPLKSSLMRSTYLLHPTKFSQTVLILSYSQSISIPKEYNHWIATARTIPEHLPSGSRGLAAPAPSRPPKGRTLLPPCRPEAVRPRPRRAPFPLRSQPAHGEASAKTSFDRSSARTTEKRRGTSWNPAIS